MVTHFSQLSLLNGYLIIQKPNELNQRHRAQININSDKTSHNDLGLFSFQTIITLINLITMVDHQQTM